MMSVDHMLQGDAATFIKYDVEGSEKQAIDGAKRRSQRIVRSSRSRCTTATRTCSRYRSR